MRTRRGRVRVDRRASCSWRTWHERGVRVADPSELPAEGPLRASVQLTTPVYGGRHRPLVRGSARCGHGGGVESAAGGDAAGGQRAAVVGALHVDDVMHGGGQLHRQLGGPGHPRGAFERHVVDEADDSQPERRDVERAVRDPLSVAANVVRAVDAVTNKPETGSTVTLVTTPMKQVATIQSGLPNVYLESQGSTRSSRRTSGSR